MQSPGEIRSETLVDQNYWDNSYRNLPIQVAGESDPLRRWLEIHVPKARGEQHCLEVGCFPGRYLSVLGKMGYVVHGLDLTPEVKRMEQGMKDLGLKTGQFRQSNFLEQPIEHVYDISCSFGFIEHFMQWEEVLLKQASLVKSGGLFVLETPNFRGFVQHFLHRWLDRENLERHYLPSMDPEKWASLLRGQGFEIEWSGYFGRFDFWHDCVSHSAWQKAGLLLVNLFSPLLKKLPEGKSGYSPYCGLIARKKTP